MASARRPAVLVEGRFDLSDDVVALTFDDGPAEWTEPILDVLEAARVRATFFVIGDAIPGREQILARTAAAGHEIGNHTLSHGRLDLASRAEVERELVQASRAIEDVTGARPAVFRPPMHAFDDDVLEVARACGFESVVLASAWTDDYDSESGGAIAAAILDRVARGAIIDLHDGRPPHEAPWGSGGTRADRWPTVAAVETIVPALVDRGYSFVTVSELLAL